LRWRCCGACRAPESLTLSLETLRRADMVLPIQPCEEITDMPDPRAMVQTMITLASASLGLVAALAWNEAIKATLKAIGLGDDLAGLYTYAILATIIAIVVLALLARLATRIGGAAAFEREAEG
jgi:hypothetical protein